MYQINQHIEDEQSIYLRHLVTKRTPFQMIFQKDDLQMKINKLNGSNYKSSMVTICYLQVGK